MRQTDRKNGIESAARGNERVASKVRSPSKDRAIQSRTEAKEHTKDQEKQSATSARRLQQMQTLLAANLNNVTKTLTGILRRESGTPGVEAQKLPVQFKNTEGERISKQVHDQQKPEEVEIKVAEAQKGAQTKAAASKAKESPSVAAEVSKVNDVENEVKRQKGPTKKALAEAQFLGEGVTHEHSRSMLVAAMKGPNFLLAGIGTIANLAVTFHRHAEKSGGPTSITLRRLRVEAAAFSSGDFESLPPKA